MANFPNIITEPCISTAPPPPNQSCSDPAFALANPGICGNAPILRIKPGVLITCALGSVQFNAYIVTNGVETLVTSGVTWSISDMTIALIGGVSGNATGIAAGEVTVTAVSQGLTGTASLTVLAASGGAGQTQPLIPTMTSDTTPSGQSSASSTFGGGDKSYLAFDGNQNTFWAAAANGPDYLQYKFASPTVATVISLLGDYNSWALLGSNDGLNFVTLTTGPSTNGNLTVTFSNSVAYQYYRVNFAGGTGSAVATMQLFTAASGCCQGNQIATVLVVDKSYSMSLAFGSGYTNKQAFADALASAYANQTNTIKDVIGLIEFDAAPTTDSVLTSAASTVANEAAAIVNTKNLTGIGLAIQAAENLLAASLASVKMIVLITDGEDKDTTPANDPIAISTAFKTSGGILLCVGVRSHGNGFNLLNAISTGGFFVNAYPSVASTVLQQVFALKGYLCAGNCAPNGNQFVNDPALVYNTLANWNQVGTLSLIGNGQPPLLDVLPGNGLYLGVESATLTTKTAFNLVAGKTYDTTVEAAGNQMAPNTQAAFMVQIGSFAQAVAIPIYTQGFSKYSFAFTPQVSGAYPIVITAIPPANSPSQYLLLINSVELDDVTDLTQMFFDNFDGENLQYVLPACGGGVKVLPAAPTVTDIAGGCIDADANAFLTATGIVDPTISGAICTLVQTLKTDGIWALMDAIYPFVGGTSASNSYNLKNPAKFQITWHGNMSFSAAGAIANDNTGYGDTGINPRNTLGLNFSMNSASLGGYCLNNNGGICGVQDVPDSVQAYLALASPFAGGAVNDNTALTASPATLRGGYAISRTASNANLLYYPTGNTSSATASVSLPNGNIYVCNINVVGSSPTPSSQISFAFVGGGLSGALCALMQSAMLAFNTTLLRN